MSGPRQTTVAEIVARGKTIGDVETGVRRALRSARPMRIVEYACDTQAIKRDRGDGSASVTPGRTLGRVELFLGFLRITIEDAS